MTSIMIVIKELSNGHSTGEGLVTLLEDKLMTLIYMKGRLEVELKHFDGDVCY